MNKSSWVSSALLAFGTFLMFTGIVALKLFTVWEIGTLILVIAVVLMWIGGHYETRKKLR